MTAGKRTYKHRNCGKSYTSRNEYLKELGFANYAEYLRSDLWRSIRVRVYACKGRTCKWCGEPATELHHSRYYRKDLTGQKLKYINPICRRCHQSIEFDPDGNKLMIPKVNRRANKLRKLLKWQVANG